MKGEGNIDNLEGDKRIEKIEISSLPKKWNAVVSNIEDKIDDVPAPPPPSAQPNKRERSESVPAGLEEYLITNKSCHDEDDLLGQSLYKALWRTVDGGPVSPMRSPVVADWKVVGSPSGSIQKMVDPLEQLLEDESRLRDGCGSLSGLASVDRGRRMRSVSVIGELLQNPVSQELLHGSSTPPACMEENFDGGGQVAQLPTMLHEELGLENEAEATEIFKRSSMESMLEDLESPKRTSASSDYFKNITFGPLGSSMFSTSAGPSSAAESPNTRLNLSGDLSGGLQQRRQSYLGLTDWPMSAGAVGCSRNEFFTTPDVEDEDYFPMNMAWNIPVARSSTGVSSASRVSRRHSYVSPEAGLEEQFSHFGFGSAGKASPPRQHYFCEDFMMSPSANGNGGNHKSLLNSDYVFQLNSYSGPLWAVEFKSGRTEIFYVLESDGKPQFECQVGDLVIVEADRGEDLGKITAEISVARMKSYIANVTDSSEPVSDGTGKNEISSELAALLRSKEIIPKRIHRLAQSGDLKLLQAKAQEEAIAMVRCQSRIRQKKLPMEVVDAEYQWDRNKLTFYFIADRRIDFRELVRDLFRIYKTRIWMCAVDKTSPRMINYLGGLVPVHAIGDDGDEEVEVKVAAVTAVTPEENLESKSVPEQKQPSISYKSVTMKD